MYDLLRPSNTPMSNKEEKNLFDFQGALSVTSEEHAMKVINEVLASESAASFFPSVVIALFFYATCYNLTWFDREPKIEQLAVQS